MTRVLYAISLTLGVAAAFLWANPAQADTILNQSLSGYDGSGDAGSYTGAYFVLSDSGFTLTGDALAQTELLQSVALKHATDASGTGSTDPLYLKVFTGSTGSGTFVGISSNTVTNTLDGSGHLAVGDPWMTWTFSNLALDKDTTYSYIADTASGTTTPAAGYMRMQLSPNATNPNPLPSSDEIGEGVNWDAVATITLTTVPEPSTIVLLASGLIGLLAYAWRKRR